MRQVGPWLNLKKTELRLQIVHFGRVPKQARCPSRKQKGRTFVRPIR